MKNFLAIILLLFISIASSAQYSVNIDTFQKQDLPTWFVYRGDTIGLVFSIEQVKKIDSDLELLSWLEKKGFTCDSAIVTYIKVVDEYGKQVTILKTNISELNEQISDKNSQIDNLKLSIANYQKDLSLSKKEIENYKKVVENNNLRIGNLKLQRNLSIGGGVLLTTLASIVTYLIIIR